MALKFVIQTVVELAAVIAVIVGFVNEDKLIAFEERMSDKIKTALAGSSDGKKNKSTVNISK